MDGNEPREPEELDIPPGYVAYPRNSGNSSKLLGTDPRDWTVAWLTGLAGFCMVGLWVYGFSLSGEGIRDLRPVVLIYIGIYHSIRFGWIVAAFGIGLSRYWGFRLGLISVVLFWIDSFYIFVEGFNRTDWFGVPAFLGAEAITRFVLYVLPSIFYAKFCRRRLSEVRRTTG